MPRGLPRRKVLEGQLGMVGALAVGTIELQASPIGSLKEALRSLREVREALTKGGHSTQGYRLAAIRLIDQAIDEVVRGIAAG